MTAFILNDDRYVEYFYLIQWETAPEPERNFNSSRCILNSKLQTRFHTDLQFLQKDNLKNHDHNAKCQLLRPIILEFTCSAFRTSWNLVYEYFFHRRNFILISTETGKKYLQIHLENPPRKEIGTGEKETHGTTRKHERRRQKELNNK